MVKKKTDKIAKKTDDQKGSKAKVENQEDKSKKQFDFDNAIKQSAPNANISEPVSENIQKKRHRRTRAEIEAERFALRSDGYEMIAGFLKALSDTDSKKYGLAVVEVEFFYPVAENYAKIINYFMPKAKEIYFVITMAAFQTITILTTRADLINKVNPKKPLGEKQEKESGPGGGGFPVEKDLTQQSV